MNIAQAALPSTRSHPDPRTVVVVLVVVNALALFSKSLVVVLACATCVVLALLFAKRFRTSFGFALTFTVAAAFFFAPQVLPQNSVVILLSIIGFWVFRFGTVLGLGAYFVSVITPGELSSALCAARVPRTMRIPMIVMLRFFPLARMEFQAVRDAAALRGLPLGAGAWIAHPLRSMEYLLVPLLASCSRIADDLTAGGLVRGLAESTQPTSIVTLRFSIADALALLVTASLVVIAAYQAGVLSV